MSTQLSHPYPSLTHPWSVQPPCIQDGYTPLHCASRIASRGHYDLAELLLINKADPNRQNVVTRGEGWEAANPLKPRYLKTPKLPKPKPLKLTLKP